jgi:hypothetical protein
MLFYMAYWSAFISSALKFGVKIGEGMPMLLYGLWCGDLTKSCAAIGIERWFL